MSNQYPPPSPPPSGYGSPYDSPQMSNPLTPPGGSGPGGKTSMGLDENVAGMLSYLTMFCCGIGIIVNIVFFVMEKNSRFVRFHAMQGLLFGGLWVALGIVFRVLAAILGIAHMGILTLGLVAMQVVILLGLVVFLILAAVKAYQGNWYKLPILGDIAENITNK
jgi:uncharacterized membrane protein